MREHVTDGGRDEALLPVRADDEERPVTIAAEVVSGPDGSPECTLFPADASGIELMTTWITAEKDSFVDLETMR
jgi:hypothetical protein